MDGLAIALGLVIGLVVAVVIYGLIFLVSVLPQIKGEKAAKRGEESLTEEEEEKEEEEAFELLAEEVLEEVEKEAEKEPEPAEEPVKEEPVKEEPAPVEEPAPEEEPVKEEPKKEELQKAAKKEVAAAKADEEDEEDEDDVEDGETEEERTARLEAINSAPALEVGERYNRSFKARLCQAGDTVKAWYSDIKNEAMSYKGVRSSISWGQEKFYSGRTLLAKVALRGKTLCVYYCLGANETKKIKVEDVSDKSAHELTPSLLRVKRELHAQNAVTLMSVAAGKLKLTEGGAAKKNYAKDFPLTSTEKLIEEGLIKVVTFKKK